MTDCHPGLGLRKEGVLEKISAACAMEWSVELEKGLRSRKPGRPVEAILQLGPRLVQWSRDPSLTMGVLNMFGLVPGEDRLYANTIFLRLADAFRSGDKHTRLCVLKVFLLELRQRNKKGKRYNGILAKHRVHNHLELLKRVKVVFDTGDVESRVLALRLFGCWSDIAKDSAEIRYMILSSLGSCHVLEVKASLFAAGCFCELSEDFASAVLERLINMATSSNTSSTVRLAGARAFAKMGCSSLLTSRAYKIGQELVLHSSKEVFLVEMLMSLSKLASKSIFLISEQVDLLLSFLTRESTLPVQTTTLRCLRFLVVGGVCRFPVNAILIKTLFHVLDKAELPPDSQCEALWILNKVFLYTLLNLPYMDMLEFVKLLPIIENAAQSPIKLKRFLALRLLVNVSCNIKGRVEMVSDGDCSTHLPSRVIVLVIDQITLLVKQVQKPCWPDSEVKRECQSLLNLILHLVEEHPEKGVLALDVIRSSIESLMNMHGGGMGKKPSGSVHEIATKSEKCPSVVSKLVFCVYSFLETCLEKLDEAGAVTTQILHKVKLLVEVIHQSSLFDHVIHAIYSLLLHSHVMWDLLGNVNKETHNLDKDNGITLNDYWVEHESFTLEFAKKMMSGGDNWSAYKVGKYAACHGAWFAATFTFWQLTKKVQSDSCYYWLKSLALFSHAESEIQLLLFPKQGISLVSGLEMNTIWVTPFGDALGDGVRDFAWHANLQDYSEKLARVCSSVCSSEQMLGATVTSGQTFYFQRWFLVVRAKVLETVVDILRLLRTNPCDKEIIGNSGQVERSTMVDYLGLTQQIHSLAHFLTQISFRLKRLAQEFDLLATSFIGIDTKSFRIISMLALSCSLLAFCTGFALYFPHLPAYKSSIACGLENADKFSHSMLIQNLVERLWHVDSETCTNLKLLLTIIGEPKRCFPLQSRTQISSVGHNERDTLIICSFAVSGFLHLQKEAKGVNNEGVLSRVSQAGLQLLLDILKKWMYLPFRIPKYFFQVRSCVGVELFAFNACTRNPKNPDGIFILPGYHLSLNLCLQMKDVPPDLPVRPTKLYCILACRTCYRMPILNGENKEFMWSGFRAWETDEMVDLNEKLLQYARKAKQRVVSDDCGGSVYAQLCFELNERGQGFSTCMLDVSAFPVGSYKIKWHSCCIDNQGSYWSLLPLNTGPVFTIKNPPVGG